MKRFGILAAVLSVALVAFSAALSSMHPATVAHSVHGAVAAPLVALSMLSLPQPVDIDTLTRLRVAPPNGFEVYEDMLYDTRTYVQAGPAAGAFLDFFTTQTGDITVTNLNPPGSLPQGQWFHCKKLFLTPLIEPSLNVASTAAGRAADLEKILNSARSFLRFSYQGQTKVRPAISLEALGGVGGSIPTFGGNDTAPAVINTARNHPHGGYPFDMIFKGPEAFQFSLFVGVQTAISADLPLRLGMWGWRYVPSGRTG